MFDTLQEKIQEYQSANEGSVVQFQRFIQTESETQPYIMSIATLLTKRVHEMVLHGLFLSFLVLMWLAYCKSLINFDNFKGSISFLIIIS